MNPSNNQKKKEKISHTDIRKQTYKITGICFAVFISLIFLLHVILPDTQISETEKRTMTQKPAITAGSVFSGRFSNSFEEYASDQMPFRKTFVTLKSTADLLMGKNESNGVYRGIDGFLIEKVEEPDMEQVNETISQMKQLADQYPSEYTLILFPNAATVESDKLPLLAPSANQEAFSAQVCAALSDSPIRYMDLTNEIKKAKEQNGQAFYKTDHHWTTDTAYYLAPTILNGIGVPFESEKWTALPVAADFKGSLIAKSGFNTTETDVVKIYKNTDEQNYLVSGSGTQGKIATVYSQEGLESNDRYTVFLGGNDGWIHIETDRIGSGHLLVFKNSYFNSFLPFLLDRYETIDVVDPRYFCEDLQSMLYQTAYDDVVFFYDMGYFAEDTSLSLVLGELGGAE